MSRRIFNIVRGTLIGLVALYGLCLVLLEIPAVQGALTQQLEKQFSAFLETEIEIENITIDYPNRLIVDGLIVEDKDGKEMLKAARLAAKFEWTPLLKDGRIVVHTAQIFGLHAHISRPTPEAETNIQFLLDKLASKDTTESAPLNLRINSLLIRRSHLSYDVKSEKETPGVFNPSHLNVEDLNMTATLKCLSADSINATIKRFELKEGSGLEVQSMKMALLANTDRITLADFVLRMPQSRLMMDTVRADFPIPETEEGGPRAGLFMADLKRGSYLTLKDIAPFVPALKHFDERLYMYASLRGRRELMVIADMHIHSAGKEVELRMTDAYTILHEKNNPYVDMGNLKMSITQKGLGFIWRNLQGEGKEIPQTLTNAEYVAFNGEVMGYIDHLIAKGHLQTGIGEVNTTTTLITSQKGELNYKGKISSQRLEMNKLLGDGQKLGDLSLDIKFDGHTQQGEAPSLYLKGVLPTLQYNGYEYQQIRMDGILDRQGFDGLLALDDPNAALTMNGKFTMENDIPTLNLTATLNNFRPHDLQLTEGREGITYGLKLRTHFQGNTPDNIQGTIDVDSLTAWLPTDSLHVENIHIEALNISEGEKRLTATSDFMTAHVEGKYHYRTLPESFEQIVYKYLPSLVKKSKWASTTTKKRKTTNDFSFDIKLKDSKFYPYVAGIPLEVSPHAELKGQICDADERMRLEGYLPNLTYGDASFESGVLRCENTDDRLMADFSISKQMSGNARVNLMMNTQAANDSLKTTISWGNDTEITYCGTVDAYTTFSRQTENSPHMKTDVKIMPTDIILNDTVWHVHQAQIVMDSGYVDINNLQIEHADRHLNVNGKVSDRSSDSLIIDLNRIGVEYIMDILRFHPVEFAGDATGRIHVREALGEMQAHTRLQVENFHFNGGLMGDMDVKGKWDNEVGIMLDADIREGDKGRTTVLGFVSPQNDSLDLRIGTHQTNLAFLNSFIGGIFGDVAGRASGDIHLYGPFKRLNLIGDALASVSAKVKVLNTAFNLRGDSVHLRHNSIDFEDVTLYDAEGHRALANGQLTHNNLKNIGYNFRFEMDNFLFYNTFDFNDMPFYGNIYGTGNALLWGGGNELHLNGTIRTGENTLFVYNMSSPEQITDNRFVTFVDKTPRPIIEVRPLKLFMSNEEKEEEKDGPPLQLFIDAAIDATDDATMKVIMDTRSGDFVSAQGNGTINVNYTNEGTDMRGTYTIESGIYKMSMQEVIRKDFILQPGSEVNFTGNGGDADLDIKAIYTVNSASLSDLIPDASFNNHTVKVNCIINMTGKLASPVLGFDIDLPTVNDEEKQLVRSAISTDEQMRMQIIYLLGVGKFYTYDYANTTGQSSSDAMSSLLSSTLSGQLNDILSQALNMSNWNFSSNLSTGQEGWSDLEVEGILSGRLLNNRLLINGNFGYRENQLANSNFVGDFNLQWLLTPSGNIRLKAYNMANDRYFAKQTFNTQGFGIIYKRDFNSWRDFFKLKKR